MTNSTVSANTSTIKGGGIVNYHDTSTLTNSTISGNAASRGGGIYNDHGALTLTNSTVSGNTASGAGGGGVYNFGTLTLAHSLISGNTASSGQEIYNYHRTINAANFNLFGHSGQSNAQAFSNFTPSGSDLTATSDGTKPTALASILNTTLANNGGSTKTHVLVGGSPAIDAAGSSGLATDQRGVTRPQGPAADIGAVEVTQAALPANGPVTQQAGQTQTCMTGVAPYVKNCTVSFALKNTSGGPLQINSYQISVLSSHVFVRNGTPNPGQVGTVVTGAGRVANNATFQPSFTLGLTTSTSYTIRFKVYGYAGSVVAAGSQMIELGEFETTLAPAETTRGVTLFLPAVSK